eukprot:3194223-Prymnesium_polylepis.1
MAGYAVATRAVAVGLTPLEFDHRLFSHTLEPTTGCSHPWDPPLVITPFEFTSLGDSHPLGIRPPLLRSLCDSAAMARRMMGAPNWRVPSHG